jgi:ribose 5-phosphate isomerase RpiB
MKNEEGEPDLTYLETGFLSALLLNLQAVSFVVGGCGTGQGYMNMVLQFPNAFCGLIMDPVDAYLFSQVNAGNCISLVLNKGYGNLGADINLRYVFERLFAQPFGGGYPPARQAIQIGARKKLETVSKIAHRSFGEILAEMDQTVVTNALAFPGVAAFIRSHAPDSPLKAQTTALLN